MANQQLVVNPNSPRTYTASDRDLVPVTLVSADLDLQSLPLPDVHPLTSKSPKRTKLNHYKRRASIQYKCLRTRFHGRLALLEHRLPNWIRSYVDHRRNTKRRNSDAGLWHIDHVVENHWDTLGDGNVLDAATPVSQPNDPIPRIDTRSAGSYMGAALGTQPISPPHAFDEHYRAYSVAMMPRGGNRDNVAYGGKILMPPSALARLTTLNFPSPWMFQLRNPENAAASTHAGVLEFIADEGVVFLPHWMMKTLKLNEGDPLRVTGASLPKGKFVKLQAQESSFIEVSDPKAVLEQALRNFTCLTQGDIIEISYNTIVFGLLVMETRTTSQNGPPSSRAVTPSITPGISVFNTDLEVDFATPKGYKEPTRVAPKPVETMASRLGLEAAKLGSGKSTPVGSRPSSSMGGAGGLAPPDTDVGFEAFKGRGETLNGRKTKGKGVRTGGRKITEVDSSSKIERTDKPKFITSEMLEAASSSASTSAQPLDLEFGQLFFGYPIIPYTPPPTPPNATAATTSNKDSNQSGSGSGIGLSVLDSLKGGNTLSGRPTPRSSLPTTPARGSGSPLPGTSTPGEERSEQQQQSPAEHDWGSGGQRLGARKEEPKKKKKRREIIEID